MLIKIDVRENDLISNIKGIIENTMAYRDIEVKIESLPIGDIILSDKEKDLVIIERKTVSDLLASIKDGRYEEQSYRLNGSNYHNHNIIYLIEGDINRVNRFKDNRIDKTILYSSIFSLNYYKGFSVLRTFTIEETALFICNSICKLKKETKKAYYKNINLEEQIKSSSENESENIITKKAGVNVNINDNVNELSEIETINVKDVKEINLEKEEENIPYVNVIKKVKKENITPENIGEIMLCQIPGISSVTAIAIMNHYHSLKTLIEEIVKDVNCLQKITYINNKGQIRKLNKTCIKNISLFLLQNKV